MGGKGVGAFLGEHGDWEGVGEPSWQRRSPARTVRDKDLYRQAAGRRFIE